MNGLHSNPNKQPQEVIFTHKLHNTPHPFLTFNNSPVQQTTSQKHLGMILDTKLDFQEHLKAIFNKVNKTIGVLRKLQNILPRPSLIAIYRSFIRPHLDYGDVIYDQSFNASFHQKMESIQYNAALALTGAIRGTSREKLYQELGLESLQHRRWYRKLCCFYKILKNQAPPYLYNLIPIPSNAYRTRNANAIPLYNTRHDFFKNSFLPSTIIEWNKLGSEIRNSSSLNVFKKQLLSFIRPFANSFFKCHNSQGIKLITRLRLGLSHLRKHKFKHSFQDTLNPICSCSNDIESTTHYLLHCSNYIEERLALLNQVRSIDSQLLQQSDSLICQLLLFGKCSLSIEENTQILNGTIEYVLSTKRFDGPLL